MFKLEKREKKYLIINGCKFMHSPRSKGSIPFVYVEVHEDKSAKRKKIIVPKTMKNLKENCQKVFPNAEIVSFLDKNNYLIDSINDVTPEMTIFISNIDPAFCEIHPSKRPFSPDKSPEKTQQENLPPVYSNSFNVSSPANVNRKQMEKLEQKIAEEKEKMRQLALLAKKTFVSPRETSPIQYANRPELAAPAQLSPRQQHNLFVNEMLLISKQKFINPYQQREMAKHAANIPQKRMVDMRKISRPPSSSSSDSDDDPKADIASVSTKMSAFLLQHEDNSSDEETEEMRRHKEEKALKKMMYQSCVTIRDPNNQAFQQLIEEIIPPQDAPKLLEEGIDMISPDRRVFVQKSSDMECEHIYVWMKGAADQPFLKRFPMQPYHDPITGIVMNFLTNHRHIIFKNFHYRFKAAVIGPSRSGKSTLLGNAVDNYILDLAATGLWKSTFLFAIDMKQLARYLEDYPRFYQYYLGLVIEALGKQNSQVSAYIAPIKKQMKSVTEFRSPLVGLHPFRKIDAIAQNLNEAWRNPNALCMWLNHVMMLPITMAYAVGFKSVSLFVDNIEYLDVNLTPHSPFNPYSSHAIVIEHVKYTLCQANFILSAESSEKLFQILPPFDEEGIDLSSGIDYITPFEATSDLGSRLKYDYLVECREEAQPIRISIEMCGGVVPFVAAWDELHHSLFIMERTNINSEDHEEMMYDVISDAQKLVDLLFVCDGSNKITVIGVKRDKKGNEIQLKYDDAESEKNKSESM